MEKELTFDEKQFYMRLYTEDIPEAEVITMGVPRYDNDPYRRMNLDDVLAEHPEFRDVDYVVYYFYVWDIGLEQLHYFYEVDKNTEEFPSHNVPVAMYKIIEYQGEKYLFFEYE